MYGGVFGIELTINIADFLTESFIKMIRTANSKVLIPVDNSVNELAMIFSGNLVS